MSEGDRYPLLVYGATGFTGRQLVSYLCGRGVNGWAIAGRRRAALEAMARPRHVPVLVASLDDPEALRHMTSRARVVLNLAGPFAPQAEGLIDACIATGTNYADISGEIPFTRELINRHHEAARRSGVTIVPQCGYESLPFDLLTAALHRAFRAGDGSALRHVEITAHFTFPGHPLRAGAGVSGGTLATTLAFARERGPGVLVDPFALVVDPPPAADGNAIDLRPRRDRDGHWLSPLAPAPFVNPAVVHRSNALAQDPYAPGFTYRESFDVTRTLSRTPFAARAMARGLAKTMSSIVALSEGRGGRPDRLRLQALAAVGPRPGAGPTERQLDRIGYHLDAWARSDSGATAHASVDARGNAGYRSTPNMLAEAGLALARGDGRQAGIVTPAAAFGPDLLERLEPAGIRYTAPQRTSH